MRVILLAVSIIVLATACGSRVTPTPAPMPTVTPRPTATPPPTATTTPIPNCPAPNPSAAWAAPDTFANYPDAIQSYLTAGGARESLTTVLRNASSINDQWGSVQAFDLTGDGDLETIVSIFDPTTAIGPAASGGMFLVYGCANRQMTLLYSDVDPSFQSMLRIVKVGDLIGAKRGGQIAMLASFCGANTCYDTLDVLGWNGETLVSLMSDRLMLPYPTYTFIQADADPALEIEAQGGAIQSIGAGPQRAEKQRWQWTGAQYVKVLTTYSPPVFRIHAVYEGDDAFAAGDYAKAIDWYSRVITDDTLKDLPPDWLRGKAHDRDTLMAYARFRLLLIGVLRGDANARDQLDQLTVQYPDGSPVHQTQQMAQTFWNKVQQTKDVKAACAAANAYANSGDNGQYLIVDDLNLFGYANRTYTSDDMCPIK